VEADEEVTATLMVDEALKADLTLSRQVDTLQDIKH
jgi:hypothetical protein